MYATDLIRILEEGLREIPLLDIHTHLDAAHLTALRVARCAALPHDRVGPEQRRLPQPGAPVGGPQRRRGTSAAG